MALKRPVEEQPSCLCYYYCYYRPRRNRGTKQLKQVSTDAVAEEDEESYYPSVVRIVLAGGLVEVYPNVVPASEVMEKHPGLCVARPEVFSKPQESLVGPTEQLLPGEKFYLVPHTTVKKLRERQGMHRRQLPGKGPGVDGGGHRDVEPAVVAEGGASGDGDVIADDDGLVFSARDFYVSKDSWRQCAGRRRLLGKAGGREMGEQLLPQPKPTPPPPPPKQPQPERRGRPSAPPCRKKCSKKGLGWKPSLDAIEEISP